MWVHYVTTYSTNVFPSPNLSFTIFCISQKTTSSGLKNIFPNGRFLFFLNFGIFVTIFRHDTSKCAYVSGGCVQEQTDLLWLQITDDGVDVAEDLVDEGHHLAHLNLDEMASALLGDLDEGVTRHVLHSIVGLCKSKTKMRTIKSQRVPFISACIVFSFTFSPSAPHRAWTQRVCWRQSWGTSSGLGGSEDIDPRCTWCLTRWWPCCPSLFSAHTSRAGPEHIAHK